jgi:DNA-binding transcriptional ArsR family regulator
MPERRLLDQRIAKAVSHPLRRDVLEFIVERGEASPNEAATALGASLGTVSYHVHILRDLECVELVRTEPRRGALEHFYRPSIDTFLDDTQWSTLPVAVRRQLAGQTVGDLIQEMGAAAREGGFDREGVHVDRMPLRLDETGWAELSELLLKTLDEAGEIQRRTDARNAGPDDVQPSMLGILHFRRPQR